MDMESKSTVDTGEELTKDLNTLKGDLSKIADDLKEHAGAHVGATRELVQAKLKAAREAATARPLAVLGVGFLLGFLVAIRLRR